jgi:ATP-dependent helicase/nuclease subunit B
MTAFLEHTAAYLLDSVGEDIPHLCIVLPNLREGLFLRKHIAARLQKTIWAPYICSAGDFLTKVAGLQPVEPLHVLFTLYRIHLNVESERAQAFEEFIQWAPQLVADFDEADRYLADVRQLFSALTDARALSLWNPDKQELTDFEKQYLRFYNSLYRYYGALVDDLLRHKQAYPGLMYRMASLGISKFNETLPWRKVVFAGFNSLTAAEEKVMDHLYAAGKAEFLWDADTYYLDDPEHEAGEALRRNRRKWGGKEFKWVGNDLAARPKSVSIVGVPGNTAQAGLAGELVKQLGVFDERTALVLQDEGLLMPLLYSLPGNSGEMNITMGLPLAQTPVSHLLDLAFRMHLNREKFSPARSPGRHLFYFRDMLSLLRHPVVSAMAQRYMDGNAFVFESMLETVRQGNKVFISASDLLDAGNGLFSAQTGFLKPFFSNWDKPEDALRAIKEITGYLRDQFIHGNNRMELEFLYGLSKIIFQLDRLLKTCQGTVKSLRTLHSIYTRILKSVSLPFSGEPLRGLQIMGMLETRGLDFENLIILSCNENLLPRGRSGNSFIPLDLKLEFGLPTYRQKDAVYAYHFYRLLQRADNIHLLYNSETGEFGGGEMSRFLQQVMSELKKANPSAEIKTGQLVLNPEPGSDAGVISVPRDEPVMRLLREKAEKGFSPTALNNFRACGLKFYFNDLAGLKEPDETGEEIDNRILGNIIHEALHSLYKGFTGRYLDGISIEGLKVKAGEAGDDACSKEFSGKDVRFGRNLLLVRVAKMLVKRFLDSEIKTLNGMNPKGEGVRIEGLEQHLERKLDVETGKGPLKVRIRGFADRIDSVEGGYRIIDYKTGSTDNRRTAVRDWESFPSDPVPDHAFQLLSYCWLYAPKMKAGPAIQACILSLRRMNDGILAVSVPSDEEGKTRTLLTPADLREFEKCLEKILKAVFNESANFEQTKDLRICAKCPYKDLCSR